MLSLQQAALHQRLTPMLGNELLDTIASLNGADSSAAILRHARRFPIMDSANPTLAEITPDGAADAESLGRRITGFDHIRLFHSPVKRCLQTAECIARGAQSAGIKVELVQPELALGVDYILDLAEAGRLSDLHGEHFVRLWIGGEIPQSVVRETSAIVETKLSYLIGKLGEPSSGGRRLDLHVTHDWNILIMREHVLGVRLEDAGWVTFLDGLAFSISAGQLLAVYREQRRQRPLLSK
jgi:broad specificity phosphatase PhoE